MKKLFALLLSFSLAIIVINSQTSCKKETVTINHTDTVKITDTISNCTPALEGLWEGTYQTDQVSHNPLPGAFTFYTNGSLIYKATGNPPAQDIVYSQGRWSLSNNVLTFRDTTINYSSVVIQEGSFTYDPIQNRLTNGVWNDVTSDNGQFYTGTFPTMVKVE